MKRLEECLSASCRGFRTCPYSDTEWDAVIAAYELLKEQEPRVLTIEEIASLTDGSVIWEEFYNGNTGTVERDLWATMKVGGRIVNKEDQIEIRQGMETDEEGSYWRWWSSKPTEEQRRALLWKKGWC